MIKARKLTQRFGDVEALLNLDSNIPQGCIYGLVGANGAGKSTFLRLCNGIYKPDDGHISVNGGEVFDNPCVKEHCVFVPDELYFLPQSNLNRMALLYESMYPRFSKERFEELCAAFKLDRTRLLSTFSKGMRRQAATVLALSAMTDYVFFDETFDGLDPVMRNLVKGMLYGDVLERGCTAVVTSHSLRELEDTCDQLALLYHGGIVFESDVQNLKTSLFKVQVAFSDEYDKTRFDGLEILSFNKQGSVANMIIRGDSAKAKTAVAAHSPLLLEILPLTLEEVFLYEMEALGYSFEDPSLKGGERA
ncbi:MAG: ABC transporter ATP-binding protein [Clostridiales bacterium]|nr:ABC transporter ATP-binding protein [Clostridiales bacterium]